MTSSPRNRWITWLFLVFCIGLFVSDFVIDRHGHFPIEDIPAFFSLFGFVSFLLIVFIGGLLRKLIMRSEDYYEPSMDDGEPREGSE